MRSMLSIFLFVTLLSTFSYSEIPTEDITAVREKVLAGSGSVSASDKAVIDKFIRSAIDAMFLTDDSAEIAQIRHQIRTQKGDKDLSMFASTYLTSVREYLRTAFEAVERIQNPEKKTNVIRNIVILTAELKSLMLAEFGLNYLQSSDIITRYWAVKAVVSSSIVDQMNTDITNIPETTTLIYEAIEPMVLTVKNPEIQRLLIEYAGGWNDERAVGMLAEIAGRRIEAYQNWTVDNEWLEIPVLKALAGKYQILQLQTDKTRMARLFAELYAMVIQRWMLGQEVLNDAQKQDLVSVMVEIDQSVISDLGLSAGRIKSILERGSGLDREFDDLFGTATRQGELSRKLRFNYGQADGRAVTSPPKLTPPPADLSTQTAADTEASGG